MLTHDEIVARAVKAFAQSNKTAIIRAFVASLSTRNLPARSPFGSYVVLQKLSEHPYQRTKIFTSENCSICGLLEERNLVESKTRVLKYPFQIQHTALNYAAFDLETFANRQIDEPTHESIDCLSGLMDTIRALPSEAQLTQLEKSIGKVIKSNKHERMILLETLGYAGVLCPKTKKHYGKTFITWDEASSDQPKEYFKREWAYPVRFWTGSDGVNEAVVKSLFGKLLEK